MIYIVLLYLLFLWLFNGAHKGWILFWGALSIISEYSDINILILGILIGLAKVSIDLYDADKK